MWDNDQLKVALAMLAVASDQRCREIEAGQFTNEDRHALCDELIEIAKDARPET